MGVSKSEPEAENNGRTSVFLRTVLKVAHRKVAQINIEDMNVKRWLNDWSAEMCFYHFLP